MKNTLLAALVTSVATAAEPAARASVPTNASTERTATAAPKAAAKFVETVMAFTASDGTPLEGKLSVPAEAIGAVPVVYHLHGAGPRNFDHAIRFRDTDGQRRTIKYYDYHARELAQRGIAFFRISKRGCTSEPSGQPKVDRAVFSKTTPTSLLDDYAVGLAALRQRKEIDPQRIILSGASEGTYLAGRLAVRSPEGIVGLVLKAYAADNQRDTVVWQNTVGPFRNIQKLFPAALDGALTREEYDAAVKSDEALAKRVPFDGVDMDKDGQVTATDMTQAVKPRLDAILKAVQERDDNLIWQAVANLSSAYLLDGWEGEPHVNTLLKLTVPISIYHGDVDGTCRVEGVQEAAAAFKKAGKNNLTINIYPDHDHDLNWAPQTADAGGPVPLQDSFAFAEKLAKR